jgi:hypothetical protein
MSRITIERNRVASGWTVWRHGITSGWNAGTPTKDSVASGTDALALQREFPTATLEYPASVAHRCPTCGATPGAPCMVTRATRSDVWYNAWRPFRPRVRHAPHAARGPTEEVTHAPPPPP